MNLLFVSHCDFTGNSAIHIFNIANRLVAGGIPCIVAAPGDPASVARHGEPLFRVTSHDEARRRLSFPDGRGPDLVHAWTTREVVRRLTETVCARHSCRYVVHLEDNEDVLLACELGVSREELLAMPEGRLDTLVPDHRSHPLRSPAFLRQSIGITALIEQLLDFTPPALPGVVFWPGYEDRFLDLPRAAETQRLRYGIQAGERVLVYSGNVHTANATEVRSLYLALEALRRHGYPLRLVKTGLNHVREQTWTTDAVLSGAVVDLGFVERAELPAVVALADILVQPGRADDFNNYRFPSKLPEFLASGRPVVLPRANIGRCLRDGEEALVLQRGDALEICEKVALLLDDNAVAERIGSRGRDFAVANLTWDRSVGKLRTFYEQLLSSVVMLV